MFTNEDRVLKDIEEQCLDYTSDILSTVCRQAVRTMKRWGAEQSLAYADNYPKHFTFFDILSVEHQYLEWYEINPLLTDSIEDTLYSCFKNLPIKDQFFVEYSQCYTKEKCLDSKEITGLLVNKFIEMLNDHYSASKKIRNFDLKKSW